MSLLIKSVCKNLIKDFSNAIIEELQKETDPEKDCQAIKLCKKTILAEYFLNHLASSVDEAIFSSPQSESKHPRPELPASATGNRVMCSACKKVIDRVIEDLGSDRTKVSTSMYPILLQNVFKQTLIYQSVII